MALSFLHGSLSTIDVTMGGTSIKAAFGRWLAQIVRGATRRTTFADGGWVAEQPGDLQILWRLDGYLTKGTAWSDIFTWITSATPIAMVLQADTGCTLSGSGNTFEDGADVVAAANAGRGVAGRSTGSWSSAWVIV
jgi:hypothetical protein